MAAASNDGEGDAAELAGGEGGAKSAPPRPVLELSEPLRPVVDSPAAVRAAAASLAAGSGPVAVDTERASGYRYGSRACLVQLRRAGAGTWLVDPLAVPDLHPLAAVLAGPEWVLHAASQDLPCLTELGLSPQRLFDTELAGRLAGFERVGLAAMCERILGVHLEKGFSAADWSTRPLPGPWLRYAALDVEPLAQLREALVAELAEQGKLGWATEEFAALAAAPPAAPRSEPWRRLSGLHQVRGARRLGVARALWEARDDLARRRDLAPGRVLSDAVIVRLARDLPASIEAVAATPGLQGPRIRRTVPHWWSAIQRGSALAEAELPRAGGDPDEVPPANRWPERNPPAAARLGAARAALGALAERHRLPVENLLEPAAVRRLAWNPPGTGGQPPDVADVVRALSAGGARRWQVELTAAALAAALAEPTAETAPVGAVPAGGTPAGAVPAGGTPAGAVPAADITRLTPSPPQAAG